VDNGNGMSGERLEELLNSDSYPSRSTETRAHIGLINAKKRIEILYGSAANFHIESTEDVGTLITISIPCGKPGVLDGGANVQRHGN
jgi:sensor histidine kinase YesM